MVPDQPQASDHDHDKTPGKQAPPQALPGPPLGEVDLSERQGGAHRHPVGIQVGLGPVRIRVLVTQPTMEGSLTVTQLSAQQTRDSARGRQPPAQNR